MFQLYIRESKIYLGFFPPSSAPASSQILTCATYVSSVSFAKTDEEMRCRSESLSAIHAEKEIENCEVIIAVTFGKYSKDNE